MKRKLYLFAAAALSVLNMQAEVYFVAPQSRGNGDGTSWENAKGADWNYVEGDIVYMSEGTYTVPNIRLVNGVTYQGGFAASAKGADISDYDPASYVTRLTSAGTNQGAFLILEGEGRDTETVLAGVSISGIKGTQDFASLDVSGSVLYLDKAWLTMQDVTVDGNETACGGIIVPVSSVLKCIGCVFSNNVQTMVYDSSISKQVSNASILFNLKGTVSERSLLILERCAIFGNTFSDPEMMSMAEEGGLVNVAKSSDAVLVNNFIDGNGLAIKSKAGFMRTNGGTNTQPALGILAYNTIFNFSAKERFATGSVVTLGANTTSFVGGNIIVSPVDYEEFEIGSLPPEDKEKNAEATAVANSQLSLSEGSTSNQALTYGNVAATAIAKWMGAGYNFVGGRTMIKRGNYWVEDKWAVSKDYEKGDNWKVINQKDIFGDNEAFIDGRDSYIEPLAGIGVDEADSRMILKAWNLAAYKEFLGSESNAHLSEAVAHLEDLDLSVDYFGNERGEKTWSGCYDVTARAGSGVRNIVSEGGQLLEIVQIGDGVFKVKGSNKYAEVYDISGKLVTAGDGIIDLSAAVGGIYVVKVGSSAVKVAR